MLTSESDRQRLDTETDSPVSLALPQSLRYFLFAILSLTIASLGYSLVARWLGLGLPYDFPYLFSPGLFFSDFNELVGHIALFGKPEFFTQHDYFMYPPAAALALKLSCFSSHPNKGFAILLLASGAFFAICFYRILRRRGVDAGPAALLASSVAITSYPYLFVLQRGNMEVFIWLTVSLGLWSFSRGRYAWAAVCFGLATALKLYPFIFFSLFLPRRRYLDILLGVVTTVAITLVALRAMSPNLGYAFAWDSIQLQAFGKYYAASPFGLGYDHSFFALVKFATLPWHPDLTPLVRPYTWIVAISCLALYFGRIWKLPLVNQILALSVLSVTIAPVSFDYTLLSLYASLAILCVIALKTPDIEQSRLVPFFLLYAAILTPESYVVLHGARFCGELRALCLLALLILAVRRPIHGDLASW
jgi:hypothetical protein